MGSVLGSIFGFGNKMKRRLRDAVSNPSDYAEMTADENRNEWRKNPDILNAFSPQARQEMKTWKEYANSIEEHWADPNVINYHRTPNGWDLELK